MFDQDELNALAEKAREKLKEDVSDGNDIYAMFRDGNEDVDEGDKVKKIEELPKLKESYSNGEEEKLGALERVEHVEDELDEHELPALDPYDEPVCPGGPSLSQINIWKKEWEGYNIYLSELDEEYFVFRTLNRFEYKQLVAMTNMDSFQREEIICETCVLFPSEYNWKTMVKGKAGVPSTLSSIIMQKSGFIDDYRIQVL